MTGRLYRLTPPGGKPNHYTDSYRSALAQMPAGCESLFKLEVGEIYITAAGTWERIA